MERLAENQFIITKSIFMEGILRISRDGYGKAARKAALVILGLWGLFFLYTLWAEGDVVQAIGILVILGLACLWICVGIPRVNAGRAWKALEAKYGSDLRRTTCFYTDRLEIRGEGVETTIPYEEITEVKQSRRLLVLVCADKTGVLLARNGFTKGTITEVKALLDGARNKE